MIYTSTLSCRQAEAAIAEFNVEPEIEANNFRLGHCPPWFHAAIVAAIRAGRLKGSPRAHLSSRAAVQCLPNLSGWLDGWGSLTRSLDYPGKPSYEETVFLAEPVGLWTARLHEAERVAELLRWHIRFSPWSTRLIGVSWRAEFSQREWEAVR
jgi:hypothetical protein